MILSSRKLRKFRTDSATVISWLRSAITGEKRVRTKGAAETIIKRCLGILKELIETFDLKVRVAFVPSEKNKAVVLTWVKRVWLEGPEEDQERGVAMVGCSEDLKLKEMHCMHHMGIDRTLFLVRKIAPDTTREAVRLKW